MRHCHAVLISILLSLCGSTVMADTPTQVRKDPQAIIAHRQEALAYATGLQAYLYGYPVIDYLRVMREQINKGLDPNGVYAPINQVAFQENLERPGGMFAGTRAEYQHAVFQWLAGCVGETTAGRCAGTLPDAITC
jgi:hypothetical protein